MAVLWSLESHELVSHSFKLRLHSFVVLLQQSLRTDLELEQLLRRLEVIAKSVGVHVLVDLQKLLLFGQLPPEISDS